MTHVPPSDQFTLSAVDFAHQALSVALRAAHGQFKWSDCEALKESANIVHPPSPDVAAAVSMFETGCQSSPQAAGQELKKFVLDLVGAIPPAPPQYPWQLRADLQ